MDDFEIKERGQAFDKWLREHGDKIGYFLLPANRQDQMRGMLRKAFNGGSNYERKRNEPVHCGGDY